MEGVGWQRAHAGRGGSRTAPTAVGWGYPAAVQLGPGEAHVWRIRVGDAPASLAELWPILSTEERERAQRYRFERDRALYVAAHGALRLILGGYLGCEPGDLQGVTGPFGKPALRDQEGPEGIRFNLSHAQGLALCAFARGREVGVDVEPVRAEVSRGLAERFFAPGEVAALHALPAEAQPEGFFRCWTRKEAYIKARGEGLSLPLDQFEVSLAPGEPARLLKALGGARERERWWLAELSAGSGYMAALAVEGGPVRLALWDWAL